MVSSAVNVSVISSSAFASVSVSLLERILTLLNVGAVLSTVTEVESLTVDTFEPSLPALSVKAILNSTIPSVSPLSTVYEEVHVFPLVLLASLLVSATLTTPEVKLTVGVCMVSEAVNVSVTTSLFFA